MSAAGQFSVQMVPADHPYCRHVLALDRPPRFQAWPDPPVPGAPSGQWWPPQALDPDWLRAHRPDLLHVHFGFEGYPPAELRKTVEALREAGSALVLSVHDLHNPHLRDDRQHREQLDVLIPSAEEVITLTDCAAAAILRRWGRDATVVPHPHIVPLDRIPRPVVSRSGAAERSDPGQELVIGLHAKDLRANVEPLAALPGVAFAVRRLRARGVRVRVRVDVQEHPQDPQALERLRTACRGYGFELWEHARLGDGDLHADLRSLDVTVLPYAFGTHSGWLEMCRDLGVPVAVPDLGCFAGQATSPGIEPFTPGRPESLAEAILTLLERRDTILPADVEARRSQRQSIAETHERLYARALRTARARHPVTSG